MQFIGVVYTVDEHGEETMLPPVRGELSTVLEQMFKLSTRIKLPEIRTIKMITVTPTGG